MRLINVCYKFHYRVLQLRLTVLDFNTQYLLHCITAVLCKQSVEMLDFSDVDCKKLNHVHTIS